MQSRERADSELGEHVKKAVSPVEAAPKAKHVRAIIVYSWDYRTTKPIWNVLRMQPVLTDQVQGFKALVLLHKLLVGGPQIALDEAMSGTCGTFLDTCLNTLGSNNLGLGYGALIRGYIRYLRSKLQFHALHPQYSGNFEYEDYISLRNVNNLDEGYQNLTDLFDFIGAALQFGAVIFDQLGTYLGAGQAGAGECRTSALVPLVEESGGLLKYMTSMLTAMHLCVEQEDALQPLVDRYNQLHSAFFTFYQKCRGNNFLQGLVSIPEMPEKPTEFAEQKSKNEKASSNSGLKYYEEERYIMPSQQQHPQQQQQVVGYEEDEAVRALKAMHEKYLHVKRQLLYISKEHEAVLQEFEQSNQVAATCRTQAEEYKGKYENIMKLYNELRDRFVAQVKEHNLAVEELQSENSQMREQLISLNNRDDSKEHEAEDPFSPRELDSFEGELEQVLQMIMQVEERLSAQGDKGKIPELASAIADLIRRAIVVQDIIIGHPGEKERKEWYCKNPVWSKGLISAARSIGTSTELLADHHLSEEEAHKSEHVKAAAIQVNSGVVQLVSAARVKAPPQSIELDELLEAAGIVAFMVKNINIHNVQSPTNQLTEEVDPLKETEQKIAEMNLQVEVLKREKELENARVQLSRMRKSNYAPQPNQ